MYYKVLGGLLAINYIYTTLKAIEFYNHNHTPQLTTMSVL